MRILKLAQSYGREGHVGNPSIGVARGADDVATTRQPRSRTGQSEDGVSSERRPPTISVIICAYTADRWALLLKSVASAQEQTLQPCEIIVCVDQPLFHRSAAQWADFAASTPPIRVIQNKWDGHLGSARNTAAETAAGEILAFLDDDAAADKDWLEVLTAPYQDERIGAVGGRPIPVFEIGRPAWFPLQFDWVFGCTYDGLPTSRAPLAHLIGANMSVRRTLLEQVGGFHSDHHDDMDMCHRVAHIKGSEAVIYEPAATVRHFVPASRPTWKYFWRRCFFVNKGKVEAFAQMGDAATLGAETRFVWHALTRGVPREILQAAKGDAHGLARCAAIIVGVGLAAAGHVTGRIALLGRRRQLRLQANKQILDAAAQGVRRGK
ncbi:MULTISPECIES: glycosyltransferase [unclassified Mesorhizobium]|uniref:glycosyltransferase n=2 Tax=Mesorhizobium TaxID=68287 RepID=UPI000F74FF15|nr:MULTISPECIES: glycosyltransferase [unclassified Mesorhizobium]AZO05201.1 glycosyltransferase [Mesorhizobium sp. M2A.F.Ca.ET.043.02.1.1]RUW39401.1 glycosyltransferase [Mesorhizobium sp. M2A.F.Ca.ET.015.02.1.1]RUW77721.1 glycosyltransferase [Mesorhizobium sp. M2A.F.Ca.ET.067.02.1.1]RVC98318.1 glycosyltransferase [Mesorhizobium sp. M2A.F.Ca.ET.017.03.2.1]RVD11462.1 glycosyltransferase [Mesorhizobium sp. M2A.F.Ca.ET.029.05.1.1]